MPLPQTGGFAPGGKHSRLEDNGAEDPRDYQPTTTVQHPTSECCAQ